MNPEGKPEGKPDEPFVRCVKCKNEGRLPCPANHKDDPHLEAWRRYNRRVGTSGDVGVWHETYRVSPGRYENIYVDMPPFGLGKVGSRAPAEGPLSSAKGRVEAGGRAKG